MKFIKYIFFLTCLTTFIIGFYNNSISLGQTWQKIHTNSLIGFQKLIEKSLLEEILYINFWFDIILPMLQIPLMSAFAIFFLLIYLFLKYK